MNLHADLVPAGQGASLPVRMVEKVWGRDRLPAPFTAPPGQRIGELWFEPPAALPDLLVKYIFTSDKLSVQVHPSDAQTLAKGIGKQGKEECWLVLAAEPDARLGIGFHEAVDADTMRAAAIDGRIEQMLVWHAVKPGDFFYIPANTVHAIGAGVSVIEIQQASDITYRLYDYGRPRELHLDEGIAVSLGERYDLSRWHRQVPEHGPAVLVEGPYFRLEQVAGAPDAAVLARFAGAPLLAIPLEGAVVIDGEVLAPGTCGLAGNVEAISFAQGGKCLLAQSVASAE